MRRSRWFLWAAGLLGVGLVLAGLASASPSAGNVQAAGNSPTVIPTVAPPNSVWTGKVTAHSIQVLWSYPASAAPPASYNVQLWFQGALAQQIVLGPSAPGYSSRTATFAYLQPSTGYQLRVGACNTAAGGNCLFTSPFVTAYTAAGSSGGGCTLHGPPPICQ